MNRPIALAAAGAAACLFAQTADAAVFTSINVTSGDTPLVDLPRKSGAQSASGHLTPNPTTGSGSYSVSSKAGVMTIATSLTAAKGGFVVASASVDDTLKTVGGKAGQRLFLHKTVEITGATSFSGALGSAPGSFYLGRTDLQIAASDVDLPEGDFAPSTTLTAAGVEETSFHQDFNNPGASPTNRVLGEQTIDYIVPIVVGQTLDFDWGVQAETDLALTGSARATVGQTFTIDFNGGPSFFTSADANGHDTGRRVNPGIQVVGSTGLNYLTSAATRAAGGVPEPASWALMIGGFGVAGARLRWRRRAAIA